MSTSTLTRTSTPARVGVEHHLASRFASAALGLVSIAVEVALLLLAGFVLLRSRRRSS
jgi:hypothetical protein